MEKILTSPTAQLACFLANLGVFLPLVGHLPSEKSILLDFSSSRVVAISVPFPEVQIRKGTESGLLWPHWIKAILGERQLCLYKFIQGWVSPAANWSLMNFYMNTIILKTFEKSKITPIDAKIVSDF